MEKETDTPCHSFDFHDGVQISSMKIREWHNKVYDALKNGEQYYSIASGNSFVYGRRTEDGITIKEVVNGYYYYNYPNP